MILACQPVRGSDKLAFLIVPDIFNVLNKVQNNGIIQAMSDENAKFLYSQMVKVAKTAPDLPNDLQDTLYDLFKETLEYGQNSMAEYIIAKARSATTSGYIFDD